jgi:hypothetical protein
MAKSKDAKEAIEWDLIERDWRAGVKSQAIMSKEYGVSRAAMQKHFEKRGITRDLGGKVRSAAATLVAQTVAEQAAPLSATASPASERDIIEANAAMQSQIILQHRSDIQRSRRLSMALLNELEQQTDHLDLIEQLQDVLHDPDDKGMARRLELLERLTSLGSRAGTMKSLADTLRSLVTLERQAFGLDEKTDEDSGNGIEDAIKRVEEKHGGD